MEQVGVTGGARLAQAVSFVTPTNRVPFLAANAALPVFRTETLSTRADDQEALEVNLVQGEEAIVSFKFPIQKRGPRGVPKIALTVRVSLEGEMSITLAEPGTSNIVDREGLRVRLVT